MEYGWSDAAYKVVVLKNFSKASAGGSQKANPVAAIEIEMHRPVWLRTYRASKNSASSI
jgi:hypothetical protein